MTAGSQYHFGLAGPGDGADIAALMARSELPGWIRLSYRVAPDATGMPHPRADSQTLIARRGDGALGGMVTLSAYPGFLGGQAERLAYLGQFRVADVARRRVKLLQQAFAACQATFGDAAPGWAFASLVDDNDPARRLLTSGLPGFPILLALGRMQSLVLRSRARRPDPAIRTATPTDMAEVAAFVNARHAGRALAPQIDADDLTSRRWPGLAPGDFLVAGGPGRIDGVVALWDQRAFRQVQVTGYARPYAQARGLINAVGALAGFPRLPPVGSALALAQLSFLATADDDTGTALHLIRAARDLAARRGLDGVTLGVATDDPLLRCVRKTHRCAAYGSGLYAVTWQDRATLPPARLFSRMKPEIGLL